MCSGEATSMYNQKTYCASEFGFEIGFPSTSGSGYAALAFSDDDKMGDDSVMACTINNGKFDVAMYWNTG